MKDVSLERSHEIIQSHVQRASQELDSKSFKMGYEEKGGKVKVVEFLLSVRTQKIGMSQRLNTRKKNRKISLTV